MALIYALSVSWGFANRLWLPINEPSDPSNNALLTIRIQGAVGRLYQLQSAPSLQGNSWINQGEAIKGTGNEMAFPIIISNEPARYFRIITQKTP